jgi:cytochrome b6-f complex iron-sulfur subunit
VTTRRKFILGGLGSGCAAAAGVASSGCVRWVDPAPVTDVPAPVNGKLSLSLSRYPDLAPKGSAMTVRPAGAEPVLVVHWPDGKFSAMASICTHAGCPLGFADGAVECPCHGARFGAEGEVLRAPAVQALKTYPAAVDSTSGNLIIELLAGTVGFPAVEDGRVVFPFSAFPQLKTAGGSVAGIPAGLGRPLVVVALEGGSFSALDATCTHLGCTVTHEAGELVCPCHGAAFTLGGAVTRAPATSPLKSYPATADADGVTVRVG